jgi:hypothetical protein
VNIESFAGLRSALDRFLGPRVSIGVIPAPADSGIVNRVLVPLSVGLYAHGATVFPELMETEFVTVDDLVNARLGAHFHLPHLISPIRKIILGSGRLLFSIRNTPTQHALPLFWTTADLENKLLDFQTYFNEASRACWARRANAGTRHAVTAASRRSSLLWLATPLPRPLSHANSCLTLQNSCPWRIAKLA